MARSYGTDHLSFDDAGVPGFFCMQDPAEYRLTHHSQSDTFDKVWKDDLNQGAQVLATFAYNTAQLPVLLPRRPLPYNPAPKPATAGAGGSAAASAATDPIAEMDRKIIDQVKKDEATLKSDLTYLADRIGPRLTGSPQLDRASHWTEEQFKAAGFANAHLESWSMRIAGRANLQQGESFRRRNRILRWLRVDGRRPRMARCAETSSAFRIARRPISSSITGS